jgi:amino acid permease
LGFFLLLNLVLGTGFLSIPYGFYSSGVLYGAITLMAMISLSWLCAVYVVETMARSQAISDYKESSQSVQNEKIQAGSALPNFYITVDRKFEPSEMCEMYVGLWLKIIYVILLIIITFFAALAYSTVAGSAWAVNIPFNFSTLTECTYEDFSHQVIPDDFGCASSYRFCVFIYGVAVVILSLLSLKEQIIIQVALGLLRFITITAIVVYCFIHIVQGHPIPSCNNTLPNLSIHDDVSVNMTSLTDESFDFHIKGWLMSISIFAYASILHQAIPTLTHPIREKKWLRGYFNTLFIVLGSMYLLLGLMGSLWFRDCISETCTLNWEPLTKPQYDTALRALSYFIIIFPSIDVLSAFPLVIHTTVNNIYSLILCRDTTQDNHIKFVLLRLAMKFAAAVLPLGIAMFVANLAVVLNWAGLIGFFISFYFPVLLQLTSQWHCFNEFKKMKNYKKDEEEPLLTKHGGAARLKDRLITFLTSHEDSQYYHTPYSIPVLSSPPIVILVGLITSTFLIMTIVSLTPI